jgi:hypothetical protein
MTDGDETVSSSVGQKGGAARKATLGSEGYRAIGRRGGTSTRDRHPGHYSRIGKEGGTKLFKERGPEYYAAIGRAGAARNRELIAKGRAAEEAEADAGGE